MTPETGSVQRPVDRTQLRFARIARDELQQHARADYPREACGLLLGRSGPGGAVVRFASHGDNLRDDRPGDRYELDPAHVLRIEKIAEATGLEVLGVWHSHPDHPARPSETDRARAWPNWSYVIVSVADGEVEEVRSWRLVPAPAGAGERRFEEETVA